MGLDRLVRWYPFPALRANRLDVDDNIISLRTGILAIAAFALCLPALLTRFPSPRLVSLFKAGKWLGLAAFFWRYFDRWIAGKIADQNALSFFMNQPFSTKHCHLISACHRIAYDQPLCQKLMEGLQKNPILFQNPQGTQLLLAFLKHNYQENYLDSLNSLTEVGAPVTAEVVISAITHRHRSYLKYVLEKNKLPSISNNHQTLLWNMADTQEFITLLKNIPTLDINVRSSDGNRTPLILLASQASCILPQKDQHGAPTQLLLKIGRMDLLLKHGATPSLNDLHDKPMISIKRDSPLGQYLKTAVNTPAVELLKTALTPFIPDLKAIQLLKNHLLPSILDTTLSRCC